MVQLLPLLGQAGLREGEQARPQGPRWGMSGSAGQEPWFLPTEWCLVFASPLGDWVPGTVLGEGPSVGGETDRRSPWYPDVVGWGAPQCPGRALLLAPPLALPYTGPVALDLLLPRGREGPTLEIPLPFLQSLGRPPRPLGAPPGPSPGVAGPLHCFLGPGLVAMMVRNDLPGHSSSFPRFLVAHSPELCPALTM